MTGGHQYLEEVATLRNETLGFALTVRTLASLNGQHNAHVFLCQTGAANDFKVLSKQSLCPS